MHDSSNPEIGRDAASALQDHPSSAQMPWNLSQSLHSHQRAASSSIHKHGHPRSRRHTTASPLIDRGSALPEGMVQFPMLDDQVMYGRSDDGVDGGDMLPPPRSASRKGYSSSQVDFEMFGPAAQVDTQTAATSQWVNDILDRESGNFFEYVRNTIAEKAGDELLGGEEEVEGEVTFEELFDPSVNSAAVTAQAFYHVLSLANKGRVWVDQDIGDEEEAEPFGEIRIGILV